MRRAQTTLEYIYILGIVAAALIAMAVYMKRGIQGHMRSNADQVSQQQYEPGHMNITYNETTTVSTVMNSVSNTDIVYGTRNGDTADTTNSTSLTVVTQNQAVNKTSNETVTPGE